MKRRHTTSGLPDTYGPGHARLRRYPVGCGIKDFIFLLHQDHPIRSSASLRCTRPAIHSGHRASKRQCSISAIQTGRLRTDRLLLRRHFIWAGHGDAKTPCLALRIGPRHSHAFVSLRLAGPPAIIRLSAFLRAAIRLRRPKRAVHHGIALSMVGIPFSPVHPKL